MKSHFTRILSDVVEYLDEGEMLLMMASIREYLIKSTKDPEVLEIMGAQPDEIGGGDK